MKQRCYCLTAHHQPLERRDEDVPEPKGGEVLVRMLAAGVCHSDIHIWDGEYDLGSGRKLVLRDRGVAPEVMQRMRCPLGLPEVKGKLPIEIAVSIAGEVIATYNAAFGQDVKKGKSSVTKLLPDSRRSQAGHP